VLRCPNRRHLLAPALIPAPSRWVLRVAGASLCHVAAAPAEKWRLGQRAGLVRRLLSPAEPRSEPEQAMDPHPPVGPRQSAKG
jgi:hypothetical protein